MNNSDENKSEKIVTETKDSLENAKSKINEWANKAKDFAHEKLENTEGKTDENWLDKIKASASDAMENIKDQANDAWEKTKDAAEDVKEEWNKKTK